MFGGMEGDGSRAADPERLSAVEDALASLAGAAGSVAAGPVAGAGATLAVKAAARPLRRIANEQVEKRLSQFEHEVVRALVEGGIDPAHLANAGDDYRATIFQQYRRAMDAIAEEAIPALARLTAQMLQELTERHVPDRVSRHLARLLQDATAEEFDGFQRLIRHVPDAPAAARTIRLWAGTPPSMETVPVVVDWREGPSRDPIPVEQCDQQEALALLRLLQIHNVVRLTESDKWPEHQVSAEAPRAVFERLLWLLQGHGSW